MATLRIVVSYVTAGAGHRRAAEAIAAVARAEWPEAEVDCVDVLAFTPDWYARGYPATYLALVRHFAPLWGTAYRILDRPLVMRAIQPARRLWNRLIARRYIQWLMQRQPDILVATHFLPADLCASLKHSVLHKPVVVAITDLHPHMLWLPKEADAFIATTEKASALLERRGIEPGRIRRIGIPIGPAFSELVDKVAVRKQFGLREDLLTLLVTSGGTTVGKFEEVVEALAAIEKELPGKLQLLVVCGENRAATKSLEEKVRHSGMPVSIQGFINNMPQAMAISSIVVAKAGGLTVNEALGLGLPLILYHVIPGQEEDNARYVQYHGAGLVALKPSEVAAAVRWLLSTPEEFERMKRAAASIGRRDAAQRIVHEVIAPLVGRKTLHG